MVHTPKSFTILSVHSKKQSMKLRSWFLLAVCSDLWKVDNLNRTQLQEAEARGNFLRSCFCLTFNVPQNQRTEKKSKVRNGIWFCELTMWGKTIILHWNTSLWVFTINRSEIKRQVGKHTSDWLKILSVVYQGWVYLYVWGTCEFQAECIGCKWSLISLFFKSWKQHS